MPPSPAPAALSQPPALAMSPLEMQVFLQHLQGWPKWRIALAQGWPNTARVDDVLHSPAVQQALADARKTVIDNAAEIVERIQAGAPRALDVVEYLMHNARSERVRLTAAFDMLDRAGHAPVKKLDLNARVQSASFNVQALDPVDRQLLEDIAEKAARASVSGPAFAAFHAQTPAAQAAPIDIQVVQPGQSVPTDGAGQSVPTVDSEENGTPNKGIPDDGYEPI